MKTGIIIQVRMGSTRLPGKALMPLGKRKVVDWVIDACTKTPYDVFVATTTNDEDDVIVDHVTDEWPRIPVFRGSSADVLDRLYKCARMHDLNEIVRITGDCPFVDPDVIHQVVTLRRFNAVDYVQVATIDALYQAWNYATSPTERDTVFQYIVRNRKDFSISNLRCPFDRMERYRWVLDTAEDYETCKRIVEDLDGMVPCLANIISLDHMDGEFAALGARNERYLAARAPELNADDFCGSIEMGGVARQYQPYGASTYSKSYVAFGDDAPLYVTHALGSHVFDVDGNEFIDFTGALGTTILGHSDSGVRDVITDQLDLGIAFPLAHDVEASTARSVIRSVTGSSHGHQVVFGKNGSDVTSAAVRLARVVTRRDIIVVKSGGYHGWHDWALTGTSRGAGTYAGCADGTYDQSVLRHDNPHELSSCEPSRCAAIIIEPDQFSPEQCRNLILMAHGSGALIIFDEMVTAFRYPKLTYAATYGLLPDLICLGKALGNGMPITALVGRTDLMKHFVTEDESQPYAFYSGTHFGETLSLAAARLVLGRMHSDNLFKLYDISCRINDIVTEEVRSHSLDKRITVGSAPLSRMSFVHPSDARLFRRTMIRHGVMVYSAFFAMLAHSDADLAQLRNAVCQAMNAIKQAEPEPTQSSPIMRS
jgi:glutamate-1-semialdehyde 2,1-aminomutase